MGLEKKRKAHNRQDGIRWCIFYIYMRLAVRYFVLPLPNYCLGHCTSLKRSIKWNKFDWITHMNWQISSIQVMCNKYTAGKHKMIKHYRAPKNTEYHHFSQPWVTWEAGRLTLKHDSVRITVSISSKWHVLGYIGLQIKTSYVTF